MSANTVSISIEEHDRLRNAASTLQKYLMDKSMFIELNNTGYQWYLYVPIDAGEATVELAKKFESLSIDHRKLSNEADRLRSENDSLNSTVTWLRRSWWQKLWSI